MASHLQQVLDALPAVIYMVDAAGKLTYANRTAIELLGRIPRFGEEDWHTTFRLFTLDGEEMPHEQRPMTIALKENRPVWGVEALVRRGDGSLLPVIPFPTPIRNEAGALTGAVNMYVDMTDRKRAEDLFRLAVEAAPSGMVLVDLEGRIALANSEAERLFGYSRSELVGQPIEHLVPPRLRTAHAVHRASYAQRPEARAMGAGRELFAVRKDGTEVAVEIGLSSIETDQGLMVLSTIIDISERQRAAERERLLVREIRHRSGNLFAVTKAVVAQSLSGDPRLVQAQKAIVSRLEAMSRTHRLLVDAEWNGLNLKEIVHAELEAFAAQVEITGSNIIMGPSDVQNFSLAVHELTTNAAKYGALSVAAGRVDVSWSTTREGGASLLRFRWRERNGPSVVAPSRNGFGSSLLRSVFPEARLDYKPEGLAFDVDLPLP